MMNAECGMMNEKAFAFKFIIHHSAFIISSLGASGAAGPTSNLCILTAPRRAPNIRLLK
jgi:hypothetical protein